MEDADEPPKKKARKSKTTTNNNKQPTGERPHGMNEDNWCRSCAQWGHKRSTSKLCPNNKRKKTVVPVLPSVQQLEAMSLVESESATMDALDYITLDEDNETSVEEVIDGVLCLDEED
ncbi:hypothetical protein SEMRO_2781_G336950.1 [Seminavis robusta]|uniref:Uncharacterized protein n=1 Tax=Seminavis robusta TaxID=568900 RepID=A0A9N8F0A3_9STRA|nr:hypothetical protein SEMRO_2781_G336950.1 [Seminavis robusta]|eukprot:Sro2781_g336950.1 n/a (118) ;mRNA; f:7671-8024